MDKFKKNDKVIEKGTKYPIMKIVGKTVKGGLPYTVIESWTCEWTDVSGTHRKEIKEANLELISLNEI